MGMVRPAVLAALILLTVLSVLTLRDSLHAANTITVNTLSDSSTSGDGLCSLREAITNANSASDTTMGDCVAGTGNDTIVFSLSGKITVASTLPSPGAVLEIDGSGQSIDIDGGSASRIFLNLTGTLTLNDLTISNGSSTGNGGGISSNSSLTVTDSTFTGNNAIGGGAIFNFGGTLNITNCTFSGNVATDGGAVFSSHGGTVTSSTFSNNSAGGTGAAIFANGTTVEVVNSILANSTGTNCGVESAGTIGNGTFNISDDSSCGFGSSTGLNGDTIGDSVLPLLGSLQNNGGQTDTFALQSNSPAIDAVPIANCPPTDQRGDPRPAEGGNACDIGAFEGSFEASPTPTPTATRTATATATTAATATATATSSATATATSTATATPTATATSSASATETASTTATATESTTATARNTATPTVTPTPQPKPPQLTVSPKTVKFKKVHTGSVATKSVTLHNKSKTASDVVSALQTTGQSFSIASNGCAAGIPPRGTCKIGVSFAPLAPGTNNGTLTFTDLSKSSSHLVKLNGVGFATPSPTATSTSTATPSPTATSTASATPSPTASATPTASPTPTATGVTPTATPTATATATNTATPTATPTVTPTPQPKPPQLTVSPKTVKFKKVHTGSLATKSVTLHNKSKTASDVVSALQTTGQSFSIASNGCAAGIPPRGTCKIGVSFAPLAPGTNNGTLTFTDLSKTSSHLVKLNGVGVATPASTPSPTATSTSSATPSPTATGVTPSATPSATPTGITPTATVTATPTSTTPGTPTATPTGSATYSLMAISETVSGYVVLDNPNDGVSPNPVETQQAAAASTPSFNSNLSLVDTQVNMSGAASAGQTSDADGSSITVDETAAVSGDLSQCADQPLPCMASNEGLTDFTAEFCITADTTYTLSGLIEADPNEDFGNITAVSFVTIAPVGESQILNLQASNGESVPISMSVPLAAGCYDIEAEVFANLVATSGGSVTATCNINLSPSP
jgi:CSLREA domain-containing protein